MAGAKEFWCCWFPEVDFEADSPRILVSRTWENEDPGEFCLFSLRLEVDIGGRVARPLPALRGRAMENPIRLEHQSVVGMGDGDVEGRPLLVVAIEWVVDADLP